MLIFCFHHVSLFVAKADNAQPLFLFILGAIQIIRDTFWHIFDPPSPLCHLVTLARTPLSPCCDVTFFIFQNTEIQAFLGYIQYSSKQEIIVKKRNKKCHAWHFGWPPPSPMCYLVILSRPPGPTPIRVSHIIWMVPYIQTYTYTNRFANSKSLNVILTESNYYTSFFEKYFNWQFRWSILIGKLKMGKKIWDVKKTVFQSLNIIEKISTLKLKRSETSGKLLLRNSMLNYSGQQSDTMRPVLPPFHGIISKS